MYEVSSSKIAGKKTLKFTKVFFCPNFFNIVSIFLLQNLGEIQREPNAKLFFSHFKMEY